MPARDGEIPVSPRLPGGQPPAGSPAVTRHLLGRLKAILAAWESRVARCLHEAQAVGAIARDASPDALAQVFWLGWEGAVMRARLCQSAAPLDQYWEFLRTV
ncbi:TetR family transcriptional regulator C-terminal domain-containing protein [Klebsiella variicola subsp. variicola]|nr:TetR family transcriptional regulator C-terminal domain-containing protein [Klebsiella variicola subsp. variicola]